MFKFELKNIFILIIILILFGALIWFVFNLFKEELPEKEFLEKEDGEEESQEEVTIEYILDAPYLRELEGLESEIEKIETTEEFAKGDEEVGFKENDIGTEVISESEDTFITREYQDMKYGIRGGNVYIQNGSKIMDPK